MVVVTLIFGIMGGGLASFSWASTKWCAGVLTGIYTLLRLSITDRFVQKEEEVGRLRRDLREGREAFAPALKERN